MGAGLTQWQILSSFSLIKTWNCKTYIGGGQDNVILADVHHAWSVIKPIAFNCRHHLGACLIWRLL